MKTLIIYEDPRPVTLGELCEALADGAIQSDRDDQYYNVEKKMVSRLAETLLARHVRQQQTVAQSALV